MYVRSIDQARHSVLALSLNHLVIQQYWLSLEIETVRAMKRELVSNESTSARRMLAVRGEGDGA